MMERVGEGEAIHREWRWRKCLYSTFRYTMQGREIVPVWFSSFNGVVREQSAEYFYSFYFPLQGSHGACVTAAYACMSLCLPARRSASYHIYMLTSVCSECFCSYAHV